MDHYVAGGVPGAEPMAHYVATDSAWLIISQGGLYGENEWLTIWQGGEAHNVAGGVPIG